MFKLNNEKKEDSEAAGGEEEQLEEGELKLDAHLFDDMLVSIEQEMLEYLFTPFFQSEFYQQVTLLLIRSTPLIPII